MVIPHSKTFSMTMLFAFVLFFGFSFSSSVSATSSSITMSTDDADFTIYPTESGSLIESSTGTIISITTDNYTGYKLTLESASSTSPALVNVVDSSKSIPSITSTISQSDFTSNSSYVNKWGIKPSKLNGSANSNYLPAPTSTAITIEQTVAANPTTANTYTIYPAARINYEVEAGSYSATLIAKAVINPATYTITYTDSSSSASNMPSAQTGTTSDSTVTLASNTPSRGVAYTFQGWCTVAVTNQDTTSPSCSGTTYAVGSSYSIDQITNNSLALNAIWELNNFTASFATDGTGYGSVSSSSITTTAGSTITVSGNTVTINGNTITAIPATETAQYTYAFSSWTNNCGSTLSTNNCTIQANFTRTTRSYTVTVARNNTSYGSVSTSSLSKPYGSTITASGSTSTSISVGGTTVTATASSGYQFTSWTHSCGTTLTGACTITANFANICNGVMAMQSITSSYKSSMTTDAQVQMCDERDGKLYWVSKLQDGNVWMTQNLDYDIKTSDNIVALTSDGSATTWSSSYAPQATTTGSTPYNNSDRAGTYSYDPGNYYLVGGSGTQTAITCTSSSNGGENCHYHLGNYYQYNAVTAGTGTRYGDFDATASICPAGWRLPTTGNYTDNYSFGKLTNAYGITSSSAGSSDTALLTSPLWFVRAGYVLNGSLYNQGVIGRVWSSRMQINADYASLLGFESDLVLPSGTSGFRKGGYSARCVAI